MKLTDLKFLLILSILSFSCNSFKYGYTQRQAFNSYNLITEDKTNFGNKRIKYNIGHHRNTQLSYFLSVRGNPDFIFEYEDEKKRDGINLYYKNSDSVYLFKEIKSSNPNSTVLVEARKMNDLERLIYPDLKSRNPASLKMHY